PMECTPCAPSSSATRADRPHTFFAHEKAPCPSCDAVIEARVVLRGSEVVQLIRCPSCGPQERRVSEDAEGWVKGFLARGVVPDGLTGDHLFKHTTSTCPGCLDLVEAQVVIRKGRVYYLKDYAFARAGTEPLKFRTDAEHGCPTDCGTCSDHEQHTCLPIIEVTDHCNLECPI